MNKQIVTNSENREPKRMDIYEEFCLWSAMPPSERAKFGIETQEQFVEFYNIGVNTPTAWKRRTDYKVYVTTLRSEWAFAKTGAVIEGIYRSALKGNPHSQKLWLQYFHGFSEKKELTIKDRPVIGINDILYLVEQLPESEREKYYEWLRDLLLKITILKQKDERCGENLKHWNEPRPNNWTPPFTLETIRENYINSQETPKVNIEKVKLPIKRHFVGMCADLSIGETARCRYQSAMNWYV